MLLDMPFTGSGLNNFPVIYPLYSLTNTVQPHAHNVFLQTGNDLGIFGLAAFLALFAAAFLAGWRVYHSSQDPDLRAVALGCAGGCAAFLGYGLWDAMTLGALPAVAVWAMLGILFAGERLAAPVARRQLSPLKRQRILLGLGLLALLAAPLWGSSLLVNLGRVIYNRSQTHSAAADPALARRVGDYAGLALKLNPYNSRAYVLAGLAGLQTGDAAAALLPLESAVSLDPQDAMAQYGLAEACHTLGDDLQAVAHWRLAGAGAMLIKRGADALRLNQLVEAEGWFRFASEAAPEKMQAWLLLARVQAAQKDWPAAGQSYAEALRRFPAATEGYEELAGMLYTQVKDSTQAWKIVEQGLANARPPGATLFYLRSRMEADRGDWDAAESDAAQAITLSPKNGAYLAWLGDLYLKEKRYPETLAQYDRLAAQASTLDWVWKAHQRKAQVYAAQSNWVAAADEYRSAINSGSDQKTASTNLAPLYAGLGNALEKAGSKSDAIAAYQQALQYDPSNQLASQRLAALLAK
jgi:tetratricopeptide (TPR) repeat protein